MFFGIPDEHEESRSQAVLTHISFSGLKLGDTDFLTSELHATSDSKARLFVLASCCSCFIAEFKMAVFVIRELGEM